MLVNLLITFCHRSGWNPEDYLIFEFQATCSQKRTILFWVKQSCLAMLQTVTTTTTIAFISLMWNVKQNWSPKPQICDSCSHRSYRKIQWLDQDCHWSYFYFSNLTTGLARTNLKLVIIKCGTWEFPKTLESHTSYKMEYSTIEISYWSVSCSNSDNKKIIPFCVQVLINYLHILRNWRSELDN